MIRQGTRIRINTPAKLNLFLELRRRRSDGYHELETLMAPVSVYDSLLIQPRTDDRLNFACRWASGVDVAVAGGLPAAADNLAYRALDVLRRRAGATAGADVWLLKRIPAQAGMGGASSDAAAALVAGNEVWRLGWSRPRLVEIAAELGSDVPFFLYNSPAVCRGRGEQVQPLPLPALPLVIVKPPAGLATAEVYRRAQVPAAPRSSDALQAALREGDFASAGRQFFNRLQAAAESLSPWIERMAAAAAARGVVAHLMSGSGTTYFGLCRHGRQARQIAAQLRAIQLGSALGVTTLGRQAA